MDFKQLALWLEEMMCGPCKQGYTCDSYDCEQARKIADLLNRMIRFSGKDINGNDVSGWLIPD